MTIASIAAREQPCQDYRYRKYIFKADISKQEIYTELDPTMASIVCQIDLSYDQFIQTNGSIVFFDFKKRFIWVYRVS